MLLLVSHGSLQKKKARSKKLFDLRSEAARAGEPPCDLGGAVLFSREQSDFVIVVRQPYRRPACRGSVAQILASDSFAARGMRLAVVLGPDERAREAQPARRSFEKPGFLESRPIFEKLGLFFILTANAPRHRPYF